jgi:predicted O-linked N-acetylglucosamine transferase (SPINDLY family)
VDGHVWGHFIDVFLDTFPLTGGYSCREIVAKGKPVVHMLRDEMPNMNVMLDPELQASDSGEYVARVSRLLDDSAYYRSACRRAREIARQYADTKPFASTFHSALQKVAQDVLTHSTVVVGA